MDTRGRGGSFVKISPGVTVLPPVLPTTGVDRTKSVLSNNIQNLANLTDSEPGGCGVCGRERRSPRFITKWRRDEATCCVTRGVIQRTVESGQD